ncbi:TPA: hypothetical protein R7S36_003162 [Acinetobacter baumannii]|nr:hypothetical protein [Acinetobacter baumannii]
MQTIEMLDIRISNYKPISKEQYQSAFSNFDFITNIIIHAFILSQFLFCFYGFYLCWIFSFNLRINFLVAISFSSIMILSIRILYKYLSKRNSRFLNQQNLNFLSTTFLFNEISEIDYLTLKEIIDRNETVKLKVKEIMEFRKGTITCFDFQQLLIPEYLKSYQPSNKDINLCTIKKNFISLVNKV